MTHAYRTLLATGSTTVLVLAGLLVLANVASGSTPVSFDSGTASCTTDSLGYCNGPTLPFKPNAVTITVQGPTNGPSQARVALTATSFRARFFQPAGTASASMTVTYSYIATRGATATPPAPTPTVTTTTPGGSTGTVMANALTTGYGWPDNSPPGNAISDPVLHSGAGGTGTYADPITIAVGYVGSTHDYPAGTRFYIPNLRKYFITEDTCTACHNTPSGASTWVDMWVGGNGTNNAGVLACEDTLTGNHTIILKPDANRVVVSGPLYNGANGTCAAQFGG